MLYEAYTIVRTVKYLSDTFPIKNILKEVGALSSFLFSWGGVVSGYLTTPAKPQRNTNTHRTRAIQPMK